MKRRPVVALSAERRTALLEWAVPAGAPGDHRDSRPHTARHPSPVTAASARVSFNHGKPWHSARIRRLGHDRFLAAFTASAAAVVTRVSSAASATAPGSPSPWQMPTGPRPDNERTSYASML